MSKLVKWLAKKTISVRHKTVAILAPEIYKTYSQQSKFRPMINQFLPKHFSSRPLVGAEIGVAFGENSLNILETLNIRMLYLIDPYIPYDDGYVPNPDKYVKGFDIIKELASRKNVSFIRKTSDEAVCDVPSGLDFCYIDGNHSYEFVRKDIEMYYPKVKQGGVIGGHDFKAECVDVCRAVVEFAVKHGLKVHGEKTDWWIVKEV